VLNFPPILVGKTYRSKRTFPVAWITRIFLGKVLDGITA
jgi:hypothetical protein